MQAITHLRFLPLGESLIPGNATRLIAYNSELAGTGVNSRERIALWDMKDHQQEDYANLDG